MVASEVSWKYLCKIKRVIWSQTQYERNVSWSQRRRYIGPKIIWVLTYWWEYCLCMNCFVTQHLKHITTNGAAARSSAQRGARHTALAYWRWSPHTTLNTALSSSALRIQNWRLALFKLCTLCIPHHHLRPPTKGYNTRGEEDSNSSGHRPCTCSRKCKLLDSFSMQQKCTILSGNGF